MKNNEDQSDIAFIKDIMKKHRDGLPNGSPMGERIGKLINNLGNILRGTEKINVETPMGTIVAYASCNSSYPGILIDLHRSECETDAPLCMAEYTETEWDVGEDPHIITRIWEDVCSIEYTDRIIHEKMDEFFRKEIDDEKVPLSQETGVASEITGM